MTDKQIAQFVLYRAKKSGQQLNLTCPKLVIYKRGRKLFLAVRFDGHTEPFIVRFTRGDVRGLFRLDTLDDPVFKVWLQEYDNRQVNNMWYERDYDLDHLPASLKHYVSYAIIEALKSKGYGFDLFSISYSIDLDLIQPNETYEEAAIEADLMDVELSML